MGSIIAATPPLEEKLQILKKILSAKASIDLHTEEAYKTTSLRWTDYKAPTPGAVVNVASERDIQETVSWATSNNVKFLAQSGGHGCTSTWSISSNDVVINLRAMNSVTVDAAAGTITIGAGATVKEVIDEAAKNKVHVAVGTCNSVGAIGACIGGGLGRFQGLYGLGIDNMVSARLITADGKCVDVSAKENTDVWWGLRGAGHNFGIISSLVLKAHPEINGGMHWMTMAIFTPDKIEAIVEATNKLDWDQGMALNLFFMPAPPDFQPAVAVSLWYPGPEAPGRKAYSSILSLSPVFEHSGMTPYTEVNAGNDAIGMKGGNKTIYSSSLPRLDPPTLVKIWDSYVTLVTTHKDAAMSAVLFEAYSMKKALQVASTETAFEQRSLPFHGVLLPSWSDEDTGKAARAWGAGGRELMRQGSGVKEPTVYVNFATGDETVEGMYGYTGTMEKLKALKAKWDPKGLFSHYNPVC